MDITLLDILKNDNSYWIYHCVGCFSVDHNGGRATGDITYYRKISNAIMVAKKYYPNSNIQYKL
jgi:hypothetical protein